VRFSAPRWIERLLFLIGIVCLGIWLYAFVDTRLTEMREEQRLEEALRQRASAPRRPAASPVKPAAETDALGSFQKKESAGKAGSQEKEELAFRGEDLEEGDLVGRIKIPRVGVSAIVLHGVGKKTLRRGVGHIPGTPLPVQGGNVGLAGHRDSFFRALKDIRKDDTIELTTLDGTFEYQVEWTKIVRPEETDVLADAGSPSLTLVTCYPFYYVGSAPKRFIVRAHRVEGSEDGARPTG
jgi:sortase A